MRTSAHRGELAAGAGLWLLLLLAWCLLRPGLTGDFVFDDTVNLNGLTNISADPGWYSATQYIVNGVSSSIGRPLALATFALQHQSWPGHPADFIRVNILLHLLNGAVLYWALLAWIRLAGLSGERRSPWFPLAIAALWLLSPLQTNAVLYVVQRMAVLSGGFIFLGLLLHLQGRLAERTGGSRTGIALMTAGAVLGLGCGTLAKENAALYPLLVLVFEATLLRTIPRPPFWPRWSGLILGLPLALLAGYLAYRGLGLASEYSYRPFTLGERMATEARVLFLYLKQLLLPSLYSVRILYDDLPLSRSLLEPWTTLPAVLAWLGLVAGALRLRACAPEFSFAVLWFLAAHLLESSFLPLEIAFLHRNYVAILGPLLLMAAAISRLLQHPRARRIRPAVAAGTAAYFLLIALSLSQTSALWGDPKEQSRYWAASQRDSRRAAMLYAGHLLRYGLYAEGASILQQAASRWDADAAIKITLLNVACHYPALQPPGLDQVRATLLRNDAHMAPAMSTFRGLVEAVEEEKCPHFPPSDLASLLQTAMTAPSFAAARVGLYVLQSRVAELEGDRQRARDLLDIAIRRQPRLDLVTQGVHWALQAGDSVRAREYVALVQSTSRLHRWIYRRELKDLGKLVDYYESPAPMP